jgi:uncharacterized protein YegL
MSRCWACKPNVASKATFRPGDRDNLQVPDHKEECAVNHNRAEIVFILDRSGSMGGLEPDTIGGFNAMLKKQQAEEGEAFITTVLFDDKYELLHDRIRLQAVAPMTKKEFFVRGSTALLDAIGRTIHKIDSVQKATSKEYRADKVMFLITTDGMENASREFTWAQIRKMIERRKKNGWEFIFLGANINAPGIAGRFGIEPDRTANYHADGEGMRLNFEVMSEAIAEFRANRPLKADWKERIDLDYLRRSKK